MLSCVLTRRRILSLSHKFHHAMAGTPLRPRWREPPSAPKGLLIRLLAALCLRLPSWCLWMCATNGYAVWLGTLLHVQISITIMSEALYLCRTNSILKLFAMYRLNTF